jgi:hypothetical protein
MARPNDGDLDILVNNNGGPPQLLRNDWHVPANRGEFSFTCLPNANHWLQILLIGTRSNRDGVGSRVKVYAGDLKLYDQKKAAWKPRMTAPGTRGASSRHKCLEAASNDAPVTGVRRAAGL